MKLKNFLQKTNVDNSLLIGYYGGGNYGDELLLEVLSNLLAQKDASGIKVTYQRPETYLTMHHDFGFGVVDIHNRRAVLHAALTSKNIIIGGGGLWGVDMNFNTLLLSIFLFFSRWVLRKKVYLLGVGFYSSTTMVGRIGAWFAAKAANIILARDAESVQNFRHLSRHVHQDNDIAWQTKDLDLSAYQQDADALQKRLLVGDKTLLVALRRPQSKRQHNVFVRFNNMLRWLIQSNPDKPIILIMLEAEAKDVLLYAEARKWRRRHKHMRIIEVPYNPLTLLAYVKQNHERLALIAPQLHLIMTANLAGVPFLPIVYDNKVAQLLDQIGIPANRRLSISSTTGKDMQAFANQFFGGAQQ